jgi:hypothetical protein
MRGGPESRKLGHAQKNKRSRGWADSRLSWFRPIPSIGEKNSFLFKSFYNLQTKFEFNLNLNFDDFYSQNKI